MTRQTFDTLRFALAAAAATICLFASTADGYASGYTHRSHVTGRPTLLPRYYGGDYGTGGYGAYASSDYRGGYYGYGSGSYYGAYAEGDYPDGYYGGYPTSFPRYHGGPKGWSY
jgi:hypothetical protein